MERGEPSEEVLVAAAQSGDRAAFDALDLRYRSAAVILARQYLPREAADDAAQDALIAAFQALPNLDDPSRFKAWLGAIVRNRACRLARERHGSQALPVHELERMGMAASPALVTCQPDVADDDVRTAVDGLPVGIQEAVRLYYFESWSVGEISTFTARPVTTVKWQLHAGRELLRRKLNHLEEN